MNAKVDYNSRKCWHSISFRNNRRLNMDHLIRFRCECGKKLKATRDIIGKKVRCTNCVRTHLVPESDHLPPKNTVPESMAKNTSTEQGQEVIKSKQQDSAASKPKRLITPKPNFASEKSNLIIPFSSTAMGNGIGTILLGSINQ